MFDLEIKVKVESKDGRPGKTTVSWSAVLDGDIKPPEAEEFSNVLEAYIFLGDYFYDMVERLVARSATMNMLDSLKSELN